MAPAPTAPAKAKHAAAVTWAHWRRCWPAAATTTPSSMPGRAGIRSPSPCASAMRALPPWSTKAPATWALPMPASCGAAAMTWPRAKWPPRPTACGSRSSRSTRSCTAMCAASCRRAMGRAVRSMADCCRRICWATCGSRTGATCGTCCSPTRRPAAWTSPARCRRWTRRNTTRRSRPRPLRRRIRSRARAMPPTPPSCRCSAMIRTMPSARA